MYDKANNTSVIHILFPFQQIFLPLSLLSAIIFLIQRDPIEASFYARVLQIIYYTVEFREAEKY